MKLNGVQLPWPLGSQWQQETDCQDTEEIGSWLASLLKPEAHAYAEGSSTTALALYDMKPQTSVIQFLFCIPLNVLLAFSHSFGQHLSTKVLMLGQI